MSLTYSRLDYGIAALLAICFIIGYRRGFLTQLVSLLSLFVAWIAAYAFFGRLAPWVARAVPLDAVTSYTGYGAFLKGSRVETYLINTISFILILFTVKLGLSAAGRVLNLLAKVPGLNGLNRLMGGLLALAEAAFVLAVAIQLLSLLPNDGVQRLLHGSQAAAYTTDRIIPAILGEIKKLPAS